MKKLIFIMLVWASTIDAQTSFKYVNWADGVSLGLGIIDGVARGALDAFHADRYVFEKRGWKGLYWRHNGWENKYVNNKYKNEDGSINPKKGQLLGNAQYDFEHGANDVTKWSGRFMGASMGFSTYLGVKQDKSKRTKAILISIGKNAVIWFISSRVENYIYHELRYGY